MKKTKKLIAVVHDGTYDGDNAFYCPDSSIPYKKGMTLEDIKAAYFKHISKQDKNNPFYNETEFKEEVDSIEGAWVLDEKGIKTCDAVWESDPGNDSAVYACNRAAKRVAAQICVKEIKK